MSSRNGKNMKEVQSESCKETGENLMQTEPREGKKQVDILRRKQKLLQENVLHFETNRAGERLFVSIRPAGKTDPITSNPERMNACFWNEKRVESPSDATILVHRRGLLPGANGGQNI